MCVLFIGFEKFERPFGIMMFCGSVLLVSGVFLTGIYFRAVKRHLLLGFFTILKMSLILSLSFTITYEIGYAAYINIKSTSFRQSYIKSYEEFISIPKDAIEKEKMVDPNPEKTKEEMLNKETFDFIFKDFNIKFLLGSFCSFIIAVILRNTKI